MATDFKKVSNTAWKSNPLPCFSTLQNNYLHILFPLNFLPSFPFPAVSTSNPASYFTEKVEVIKQ